MLLLQEFDIEIKDKKGSDNVIANKLSILKNHADDRRELEIEENFHDEKLFQVKFQLPWYADLVNYMACGIIPQEFTY